MSNYRDFRFRLLVAVCAALLASELGSSSSLLERILSPEFYLEFGVSLAISFIIVTLVNIATVQLDKRYPWTERLVARTLLQCIFGVAGPSLVVFLMAAIYFRAFGVNIFRTDYLYFAFPFIIALIFIFNLYYFGYYFYLQSRKQEVADQPVMVYEDEQQTYMRKIMAADGIAMLSMDIQDIAYLFLAGRQVIARSMEGKDLMVDGTLEDFESRLDPQIFFRINRKMLASREAIKGYEPLAFSKLSAILEPPFKEEVVISQRKSPLFKNWIGFDQ